MAAKGTKLVTLLDVSKTKGTGIGEVAEVLLQENNMLMDIPYMEMNEGTIHKEQIRSGLPAVYYRKANQPIPASKTETEERTFSAAHFESKSQMDEMVAKRGGADRIGFNRWNQAQGHIQAIANEHANLIVYGSPTNDNRKVAGLTDIFYTLSSTEPTSKQIINGAGTGGDNTSIWLIHWGVQSVFGVYPAGTQAGLKRTDRSAGGNLVQVAGTDEQGNSGHFWGFEEQFEVDHGLVVKDYRQIACVRNIDVSDLIGGTGADLLDLMISAAYRIHSPSNGKGVWYVNRTVEAMLHKQALTKVSAGAGLTWDSYEGKPVLMFLGRPVRRMDALLETEQAIT